MIPDCQYLTGTADDVATFDAIDALISARLGLPTGYTDIGGGIHAKHPPDVAVARWADVVWHSDGKTCAYPIPPRALPHWEAIKKGEGAAPSTAAAISKMPAPAPLDEAWDASASERAP